MLQKCSKYVKLKAAANGSSLKDVGWKLTPCVTPSLDYKIMVTRSLHSTSTVWLQHDADIDIVTVAKRACWCTPLLPMLHSHLTCWAIIYSCLLYFIAFSLQAKVYDNNTIHSINITLVNVSRDDNNFLLTCTATNVVGMTNASVQLTVHCEYTQ